MKILLLSLLAFVTPSAAQVTFRNSSNTVLRTDNGSYGPSIEEYHYYYSQWPIGLAISSTGRFFATYTRGTYAYTLGEVVNKTAEIPYPSLSHQVTVSQLNTTWSDIPFGSNNVTGLISVQALYITPENSRRPETLWVVDTGRPTVLDATGTPIMPYAQPGGPKILAISLKNDTIYSTYTFPASIHYPDSYMNDIRLDLRPNITSSGAGVAYIVDSSDEGRPGFIILDLGTGKSWRRLTQDQSTLRVPRDVPSYQGRPFYQHSTGQPIQTFREGNDGIQISPDGETLFYSPLTSNTLYSIPTVNLRTDPANPLADLQAQNNVSSLGGRGGNANGFEGDNQGRIYMCMPEHNAVYVYDPKTLLVEPFVRDPRIIWPDGASVGQDGYLYVNVNQLPYQPNWNNGVDGRVFPGAVLRVRLPEGAGKIVGLA